MPLPSNARSANDMELVVNDLTYENDGHYVCLVTSDDGFVVTAYGHFIIDSLLTEIILKHFVTCNTRTNNAFDINSIYSVFPKANSDLPTPFFEVVEFKPQIHLKPHKYALIFKPPPFFS